MPNDSTQKMLKFSIIIPCYNYARYLRRAIESAVNQPGEDYEVIVIDDGSTDDPCSVVGEYLDNPKYSKLQYFKQHNFGVSAARNRGVELSKGQFLIFLDADDELVEGALDHLQILSEAVSDAGLLVGGHYTVFDDGSQKCHYVKNVNDNREKNFYNFIKKKISVANGAIAINRLVFEKIKYSPNLPQAEDIPIFGQAFANFDCYPVAHPLVRIHRHDNSRRDDITLTRRGGFMVVDNLFNPDLLPAGFMRYKNYFYVRKCLSLFRCFYKAGAYQEAAKYYHMAFMMRPLTALRISYFKKYLSMLVKRNYK